MAVHFREVHIEVGQRTGSVFYHDGIGLHYHYNNSSDDGRILYLRCSKYSLTGCRGRAILIVGEEGNELFHTQRHNHDCDPYYPLERQVIGNIMERCRSLEYVPYSRILREERRG